MKERLKKVRIAKGYSQPEMADKLHIEVNTYKGYEYKTKNLPDTLLMALNAELNVNLNFLFTGEGPMFLPQKSEKQQKYEQALSERKTIGQRLNWLQGENHIEDDMLSKETKISESRIKDIGLDKKEPTVSEAVAISEYFGVSLDLFIRGRITECVSDSSSNITPEEKKLIAFLKKAKENNLL